MDRLYILAAAAIVALFVGATGAWQVQSWRYGEQIAKLQAKQETERAQAQANARAAETAHNTRLQEAQDAATTREIALRRDAAGARTQLAGLRDELATTRAQLAGATRASLIDRAAASHDVFEQCASRYGELAEKADRHAIDAGKLFDAWPVNQPNQSNKGTP